MSTQKRKKGKDVTTAPAPKKRQDYQIPTRVPPELRRVLEAEAAKERRKVAQMGLILLEEALTARGVWPPKEKSGA
jgi:hypothetical protein